MDKYDKLPLDLKVERLKGALSHSDQSQSFRSAHRDVIVEQWETQVISRMCYGGAVPPRRYGYGGGQILLGPLVSVVGPVHARTTAG
jgi:hypothetical protein